MKNTVRQITQSITFVVLIALNSQLVAPIFACGPSFLEPVFAFKDRPDFPRENFIDGNLGIVQPDYVRKNLFFAYRILNDLPFTEKEKQDLHQLYKDEKVRPPQTDFDVDKNKDAVIGWIKIRNQITDEMPPNYKPLDKNNYEFYMYRDLEKQYKGYVYFRNCTANALETAAETLQKHAADFGIKDSNVAEWLRGQDTVFSNCASGENIPSAVSENAPQWLKNDREYQIAAAFFYAGKYDEAAKRFDSIAADSNSVWHDLADYLVGRTFVRQASFADEESDSKKFLERAEQRFAKIYHSPSKYRLDARDLLNFVDVRLHPEQRVHELNQSLIAPNAENNLAQNLIDYNWLLDEFERDALVEEEKQHPKAQKEITIADNTNSMGESSNAKMANSSFDSNRLPSNSSVLENTKSVNTTDKVEKPNKYNDEDYPHYDGDLNLQQKNVQQFLQNDDLSDWILNYQLSDANALTHAVERYRQTKKPHWLMSVMSKLKGDSEQADEFLKISQNTPRSSQAFPTVSYHAVRLLTEQKKSAEARQKLDAILNDNFLRFPVSAQNQFFSQRMILAENLNDFLVFAQRRAFVFTWDDRGSYETLSDKPKGEDYLAQERPWKNRAMFDEDAQQVFERQMPLSVLKQAAVNPQLPDYLKRQLLITVWCRAVLLEDEATAAEIAPALSRYAPEMQATLNQYINAPTAKDRQQAALFVLLRFPVFNLIISQGMGRLTPAGKIDSYRDNWWCQYSETDNSADETDKKSSVVPKVFFLTDAEIKTAKQEREKLKTVAAAPYYLIPNVLKWADDAPDDARLPEALHLAVKTSRYSCADDKIGELSKAAFNLLHRRYPNNIWTKKTPYWFSY